MNPIEQIWKELRKRRFRNEVFAMLSKVCELLIGNLEEKLTEAMKKNEDAKKIEEYYSSVLEEIPSSISDEWEREQLQDYIAAFTPIRVD